MIRLAGWRRQRKIARLDFAYFSAVIGMTLQVSDGNVTHAEMRRLALLYGLVTFGFELMDWL